MNHIYSLKPYEMDIKNEEEWIGKWVVAISNLDKYGNEKEPNYYALSNTFQNLANLARWISENEEKDNANTTR